MKRLYRIISGIILILLGSAGVLLGTSLMLKGVNWITAITYVAFIAMSLGLIAIGWAIIAGANIKEMLRDLFSGISF